jgi:hypothetical protein
MLLSLSAAERSIPRCGVRPAAKASLFRTLVDQRPIIVFGLESADRLDHIVVRPMVGVPTKAAGYAFISLIASLDRLGFLGELLGSPITFRLLHCVGVHVYDVVARGIELIGIDRARPWLAFRPRQRLTNFLGRVVQAAMDRWLKQGPRLRARSFHARPCGPRALGCNSPQLDALLHAWDKPKQKCRLLVQCYW